jgi:hypothetical protein
VPSEVLKIWVYTYILNNRRYFFREKVLDLEVIIMAIPVVEFSREGYKIRKVFGKKSTVEK